MLLMLMYMCYGEPRVCTIFALRIGVCGYIGVEYIILRLYQRYHYDVYTMFTTREVLNEKKHS